MLEQLKQLIAIPSVTGAEPKENAPYGEAVKEALLYVLDLCDQLGFRTKNCDNRIGYAEIGEGETLIGILGHLDVVPAGEGWTHHPFDLEIEDGKIYGRGVIDNKGPLIAAIFAMKDLLDQGIQLNKRVRIIFGCQEESGDWEDMTYYLETEEQPTFGFTPDADFPAIYCEKGIVGIMLTVDKPESIQAISGGLAINMVPERAQATFINEQGEEETLETRGKSAHGALPEEGENAISKLVLTLAERINHPFFEFYKEKIGMSLHGEQMGCYLTDEASGEITINVGKINVIEDKIQMALDVRYPISFTAEDVVAAFTKGVQPYDVEVVAKGDVKPVYMDKNGWVMQTLLKAYESKTGDTSEPLVIGGGTYARAMPNIIAFGPLLPGRPATEHQKDECMLQSDLELCREIYASAIAQLVAHQES